MSTSYTVHGECLRMLTLFLYNQVSLRVLLLRDFTSHKPQANPAKCSPVFKV